MSTVGYRLPNPWPPSEAREAAPRRRALTLSASASAVLFCRKCGLGGPDREEKKESGLSSRSSLHPDRPSEPCLGSNPMHCKEGDLSLGSDFLC